MVKLILIDAYNLGFTDTYQLALDYDDENLYEKMFMQIIIDETIILFKKRKSTDFFLITNKGFVNSTYFQINYDELGIDLHNKNFEYAVVYIKYSSRSTDLKTVTYFIGKLFFL